LKATLKGPVDFASDLLQQKAGEGQAPVSPMKNAPILTRAAPFVKTSKDATDNQNGSEIKAAENASDLLQQKSGERQAPVSPMKNAPILTRAALVSPMKNAPILTRAAPVSPMKNAPILTRAAPFVKTSKDATDNQNGSEIKAVENASDLLQQKAGEGQATVSPMKNAPILTRAAPFVKTSKDATDNQNGSEIKAVENTSVTAPVLNSKLKIDGQS
jgi:hypothetical protein